MLRVLALLVLAAGCHRSNPDAHDLGAPDLGPAEADLATGDDLAVPDDLSPPPPDLARHATQVDILFMVDNSPSMAPKQAELRADFASFAAKLQNAAAAKPASYHIGVVTSDLGAGPYTLNQGQCHPGGDAGKLQYKAASSVTGLPAACATFTPGGGKRFLEIDQATGADNLGGVDLTTAFSCISGVGEQGCGVEQPLEAVYRALHDAIVENVGFLRSDALLVVVYVTDEDDCSMPANSDLFDPSPSGVSTYGVLHSFRCTQWGIACGNPAKQVAAADSNGPLSSCRPWLVSEGSKLFDVQKYVDYFNQPATTGGVKANPADVVVTALAGPTEPFVVTITSPCADQVNTPSCPILSHSCVLASNNKFFADPAVRLSAVVNAVPARQLTSLCDGNYTSALDGIADLILSRL